MLGVIDLDKPVGPTSHDMVGLVRRLSGVKRIGHAGTLDPLASGVLPILVGAATRCSEELSGSRKRYLATIRLGARSETDDAQGPITPHEGPLPDVEAIGAALPGFLGEFPQRPPAYSARKVHGRPAYRSARAGEEVDLAPRIVRVDALQLRSVERGPDWIDIAVDLRCGPGTYVRSIARDLGERLGCGGYLAALRRTEAAGLRIDDAITPERLAELAGDGDLASAVRPVGPLLGLPAVTLRLAARDRFIRGVAVPLADEPDGRRAVFDGADLIGIGELRSGWLHPAKVLLAGNRD